MYAAILLSVAACALLLGVIDHVLVWWALRKANFDEALDAVLVAPLRGRPRFIVLSVRVLRRTDWHAPLAIAQHTSALTADDGPCTLSEHTMHAHDLRVGRALLARGLLTAANAAAELALRLDARLVVHVERLLDVSTIDRLLLDLGLAPLEEQASARGGVVVHGPSLAAGALMMTEWPGPLLEGIAGLTTLFSAPLDLGPGGGFTLVDGITQRIYRRQPPRSRLGTPPGRQDRLS
jgi:hypothetical protein